MAASDFVAPLLTGEKKDGGPPGLLGSNLSAKEKYAERMKKLRDLHMKRNEARKINHQEVVDEDRRYVLIFSNNGKNIKEYSSPMRKAIPDKRVA